MERLVVSAAEAAQMLRLRDSRCTELLESGELPGFQEGRGWKVPIASLQKYVVDRAEREAEERRKIHEKLQEEV